MRIDDASFRRADPLPCWLLPLREKAAAFAGVGADEFAAALLDRAPRRDLAFERRVARIVNDVRRRGDVGRQRLLQLSRRQAPAGTARASTNSVGSNANRPPIQSAAAVRCT